MTGKDREPRVTYRRFYNHQYAAMGVALGTLILTGVDRGAEGLTRMAAPIIFILPCILFPEAMGSIKGPGYTTEPSHPGVLSFVACLLLLFFFGFAISRLL